MPDHKPLTSRYGVAIAATAMCWIASCAGPAPAPPATNPPPPDTTSAIPAPPKPFESFEQSLAALQTVLSRCDVMPPGTGPTPPPSGCDAGKVEADITELTRSVQEEIRSRPDAAQLADASSEASKLEQSVSGLAKVCEGYFRRGATEPSADTCRAGWTLMLLNLDNFQQAVRSHQ